jgi:hypothetical protein
MCLGDGRPLSAEHQSTVENDGQTNMWLILICPVLYAQKQSCQRTEKHEQSLVSLNQPLLVTKEQGCIQQPFIRLTVTTAFLVVALSSIVVRICRPEYSQL